MNQTIARTGAILVSISVILFAVLLPISDAGSCFVCVFLALGYLLMLAGFHNESCEERKVAANAGLLFSYDLLGYGMMALSTFFTGLTIRPKNRRDKWLKCLMMIHGIFFSCLLLPMTGMFRTTMSGGSGSPGGTLALEFWCAYFLPIGVSSALHFKNEPQR